MNSILSILYPNPLLLSDCETWYVVKATVSTSWKAKVWMSNRKLLVLAMTVNFGAHVKI